MHALTPPQSCRHFLCSRISLPFCIFSSPLSSLFAHCELSMCVHSFHARDFAQVAPTTKCTHRKLQHKVTWLAILFLGLGCFSALPMALADESDASNSHSSTSISASTVTPVIDHAVADNAIPATDSAVSAPTALAIPVATTTTTKADAPSTGDAALGTVSENLGAVTAVNATAAPHQGDSNATLRSGQKLGSGGVNANKHQGELANGGLSSPEGIIKWLLSTIVVLGLIFAFAYMLKRSRFVQRGGGGIVLENQLAVGPKERVVQLRVGQRQILLGVTSNNISLLCDLSAPIAPTTAPVTSFSAPVASSMSAIFTDPCAPASEVAVTNFADTDAGDAAEQKTTTGEADGDDATSARAGLPPLYPEDELASSHGSHGGDNAAMNATPEQGMARGGKRPAITVQGRGAVNVLPDDTVLKARAARAKHSQQLEAQARSQEQDQSQAAPSPSLSPSFADVLAQSYQQHDLSLDSAKGSQVKE